jgi:hypothetical protein
MKICRPEAQQNDPYLANDVSDNAAIVIKLASQVQLSCDLEPKQVIH